MQRSAPFVTQATKPPAGPERQAIRTATREDETEAVRQLAAMAALPPEVEARIALRARRLVEIIRADRLKASGIDAFLHEYELSSAEGVALMCLAEALLRIPDEETRDALIRDKIGRANWARHAGSSPSVFVNASTWALMLTGRVVRPDPESQGWWGVLRRAVQRAGEPVVREAVEQAMRIMGRQFVLGRTIEEALKRAREGAKRGYLYSFDMLGEGAKTMQDARRYCEKYSEAIRAIGGLDRGGSMAARPNISVKLSALHPRYEEAQRARAMAELVPAIIALAADAKQAGIGLCIDAEEADRLDLSLDIIEALALSDDLKGWDGLGLAIQAYQKRCAPLIDWLALLAARSGRRLMVRLVKGAYWDTEIKRSQELGLDGYPVFTRKVSTDASYLACAKKLLANAEAFYPCFATHNAQSVASILEIANGAEFEFQRLHGMGDALYDHLLASNEPHPVRIYAPVGSHEDLLAYLVRRLLENGANSSFVNRIVDEKLPIDAIIADPVAKLRALSSIPNPAIPLPANLFPDGRRNSQGVDLADPRALARLKQGLEAAAAGPMPRAHPLIGEGNAPAGGAARDVTNPADRREIVGRVTESSAEDALAAIASASATQPAWDRAGAEHRATVLERAADLFERDRDRLLMLLVREAGKTLADAIADHREAIDFLRYYASRARSDFAAPELLPGPTGERNTLSLHGRGVFLCIAPWNFPLAIFTGQVAAALAAGNAVLAKPAEQSPLIGFEAIRLLHEAGAPRGVLHFLPGEGPLIGEALLGHEALAGVAFTGSTSTAHIISRALAARPGPIVPLIAETGGQNAMIVDSSALPEQVTRDVIASAFQSAGQRCSALRVLYVQDDIADGIIAMVTGAMAELGIGDPRLLSNDVGPVIDEEARAALLAHAEKMKSQARLLYEAPLPQGCAHGSFFAPRAYEIENIGVLEGEVFGPILHVIRFDGSRLHDLADEINSTGFGLTAAIHSRVDETIEALLSRIKAGNAYVNRSQIGAVVGVQPFGGEGLSGTGPKAGGPRYLYRFALERTLSIDITASGGNAALMALED
jgi:RHH-type proline utilization regulon transcriptional repressor/proline dehydrogenase/delta 1-pyrroline-5-carboxylate dehydrogenase